MTETDLALPSWNDRDADSLADRIAGSLADRSYVIVDNFLEPVEVASMRAHMDQLNRGGDFKQAGIGAAHQFQVNREIRKDWIHWIDPNDTLATTQVFAQRLRVLMRHINRACFLGLKDFEMHYAIYPEGAYYKRHLDQFKVSDHRRLTFLCYLNPGWSVEDGGLLRLFLPTPEGGERPLDIVPTAGRLVCFRSELLEHEVLECRRPRYSLTGWMLDQLNELTFL